MGLLGAWQHIVIPVFFVLICLMLIIVVLLQKGRGGGLSSAFGGGGGGQGAFGAKTGDVFTWITVALAVCFLLAACVGVWFYRPTDASPQPQLTTPGGTAADGEAPADGAPADQPNGADNTEGDADGG
jgi:preprotein translocase subunit SecG